MSQGKIARALLAAKPRSFGVAGLSEEACAVVLAAGAMTTEFAVFGRAYDGAVVDDPDVQLPKRAVELAAIAGGHVVFERGVLHIVQRRDA